MTRIHRVALAIAVLGLVIAPRFQARANQETLNAYAEFRKGDTLIIDGQRVKWRQGAKFKGQGNVKNFDQVPLGWEAVVKGVRQPDGSILADELQVKPNGTQAFEKDVKNATDQMEQQWLKAGHITQQDSSGKEVNEGALHTSGPDVDRVHGVIGKLIPSYLKASDFRVYVAENKDWNAFACANGMIVVYDALLHDTNDDELAIVLGHELTHATHEHSRKNYSSSMKVGIFGAVGGALLAGKTGMGANVAQLGAALTLNAVQNGYGRDKEDQADRVGLRYAYEGGFDVQQGPKLWNRFAQKYGSQSGAVNFFFGNHSTAEVRAKNLQVEIQHNYSGQQK